MAGVVLVYSRKTGCHEAGRWVTGSSCDDNCWAMNALIGEIASAAKDETKGWTSEGPVEGAAGDVGFLTFFGFFICRLFFPAVQDHLESREEVYLDQAE